MNDDYVMLRNREWHIMMRCAAGFTPKEISEMLGYSPRSGHVCRVTRRPRCRAWLRQYNAKRQQAMAEVALAMRLIEAGLIQWPPAGP
jgi:FixJ family two-component response regulator